MSLKIGMKTMGCRLNRAEAAMVVGALEYEGFEVVEGAIDCDALVLHTCTVTATAQSESMRLARSAHRRGVAVVMSGCTTGVVEADRILDAGVGAVVEKKGGRIYGRGDGLAMQIARVVLAALTGVGGGFQSYLPRFASTRASVKVQDGCDFRCAYCIVPDARGNPTSRALDAILHEVTGLAARGFREVVLTGVNVACWQGEGGQGLVELARLTSAVEGIARIRLSSIEPGTSECALVDLIAGAESRLCHTLHYPLQSGDLEVLRRMRRRYTPTQYEAAVAYALERVPRLGLGADVITGFPGEDDAAFAATVALIERYPFSNLHVFPYSERPGTPAAALHGAVPVHIRRERARELIAIGRQKRAAFASSFVEQTVEVLVERIDDDGVGHGWTSEYVAAQVGGLEAGAIGRLISFKVLAVQGDVLVGE